jgi:predicted regulator of Ras-like GTPase activity (Roadblock/LC7/MglB family)
MFREVLQEVVERTEGGVAGLLMGFDGIPVDHYVREGADLAVDVETVGMEYSVILKDIKKAAELLEAGNAKEISIQAEKLTTVIRVLNEEYFVAVTLRPDGNYGKARFLLRTAGSKLLSELT